MMISLIVAVIKNIPKIILEIFNEDLLQKIRERLTNHLQTKFIALFLALLLWFYVVTEDEYSYILNIPIRVTNVKPGKIIENDYPREARVMFGGKGKQLLGLMIENDIELIINMDYVDESLAIKLKKENIPQHNIVVEPIRIVAPDSIKIRLANLVEKKVLVMPEITIQTVPGYAVVGKILVEPDSVWISGPEGEVKNIHMVHTKKKEFDEVKRDISQKIELEPIDIDKIKLFSRRVTVNADVQKLMEKVINRVPVHVQNVPRGMRASVRPNFLSLTVQGGVKVLAEVTENEIFAYIDYERKQKSNSIGFPAVIKTPPGVDIRNVNPKTFKVVLERENYDDSRN